jgi:hypothetical protein
LQKSRRILNARGHGRVEKIQPGSTMAPGGSERTSALTSNGGKDRIRGKSNCAAVNIDLVVAEVVPHSCEEAAERLIAKMAAAYSLYGLFRVSRWRRL